MAPEFGLAGQFWLWLTSQMSARPAVISRPGWPEDPLGMGGTHMAGKFVLAVCRRLGT